MELLHPMKMEYFKLVMLNFIKIQIIMYHFKFLKAISY